MDLRRHLSSNQVARAAAVLNYQPFILSDDVQTGAAWSWVSGVDPRVKPPLVFNRRNFEAQWDAITDANGRMRAMYDDLLDELATRFPGASLLDIACSNGYFPVGACARGMKGYGIDRSNHAPSIRFLNDALGTRARFARSPYDPYRRRLMGWGRYDVTVISAIMCHLPDPLHFLAATARKTKKAILFWGQIVETENLLISYSAPHTALSTLRDFPFNFNDNTRLSRGLFHVALKQLGFCEIVEIPPRPTWLWQIHQRRDGNLDEELRTGSRHVALLAVR
jgi:hypothetical protein